MEPIMMESKQQAAWQRISKFAVVIAAITLSAMML
jgi:hypothetical protein